MHIRLIMLLHECGSKLNIEKDLGLTFFMVLHVVWAYIYNRSTSRS